MNVFLPAIPRQGRDGIHHEEQTRFDPSIKQYLSVLVKELKSLQNILYTHASFDVGQTEFLNQARRLKKCRASDKIISLEEYEDDACKRPHGEFASRHSRRICEVERLRPDKAFQNITLTANHVFGWNNQCFANIRADKVCVDFVEFMPAAATTFVQVLREGCLYDVEFEGKVFLVQAVASDVGNIKLVKLDEVEEKNIARFPRRKLANKDLTATPSNPDDIVPVHRVEKFRGPAILRRFARLYLSANGKCETVYEPDILPNAVEDATPHFTSSSSSVTFQEIENTLIPVVATASILNPKLYATLKNGQLSMDYGEKRFVHVDTKDVTHRIFWNYKLADDYMDKDERRCGLVAYLMGRLGYCNITHLESLPASTQTTNKVRRDYELTSSVLYFKSLNPSYEPASVQLNAARYGHDHEHDGLLTLQRHLHLQKKQWTVKSNTEFFAFGDDFGGTPDGLVYNENDQILGTVEVKTGQHRAVPLFTEVQCKSHMFLLDHAQHPGTAARALPDKLVGFVVQWNFHDTRITEYKSHKSVSKQPVNGQEHWIESLIKTYKKKERVAWQVKPNTSSITHRIPSVSLRNADIVKSKGLQVRISRDNPLDNLEELNANDITQRRGEMLSTIPEKKQIVYADQLIKVGDTLYRPRIPVRIAAEDDTTLVVHDEVDYECTLRKVPHKLVQDVVGYSSHLECYVKLIKEGFPILKVTRKDGHLQCEDLTRYSLVLFAKPIFENKDDVDKAEIVMQNENILRIKYNEIVTYARIVPDNVSDTEPLHTLSILEKTIDSKKYQFQNCELQSSSKNIVLSTMSLVHNMDVQRTLQTHLEQFDVKAITVKYWATLMYILSCTNIESVHLHISDDIVARMNHHDFWRVYSAYVEKSKHRNHATVERLRSEATRDVVEQALLRALSLVSHTNVVLQSAMLRASLGLPEEA